VAPEQQRVQGRLPELHPHVVLIVLPALRTPNALRRLELERLFVFSVYGLLCLRHLALDNRVDLARHIRQDLIFASLQDEGLQDGTSPLDSLAV